MPDYASTIVPFAGAALLATLTGTLRRYGAHLERLSDLAAKMPESSQARYDLNEAVQAEAKRLLAVPRRVRVATRILIAFVVLLYPGLLIIYNIRSRGLSQKDASISAFGTILLVSLITLLAIILPHYLKIFSRWAQMSRKPAPPPLD